MWKILSEYAMKKIIKRKIVIDYRWWRKEGIKPEHIEALEESATDHIWEMMAHEYKSGKLNDNIHMTPDDPEDGVEYTGWWEISP